MQNRRDLHAFLEEYYSLQATEKSFKKQLRKAWWTVTALVRMRNRTRLPLTATETEACQEKYNETGGPDTVDGIQQLLSGLGQTPTLGELEETLAAVRWRSGQSMPFETFVRVMQMLKKRWMTDRVVDTVEAYVALGGNRDGSGAIDCGSLKNAIDTFQLTIDIEKFIHEADVSGSGQIEYADFATLFQDASHGRDVLRGGTSPRRRHKSARNKPSKNDTKLLEASLSSDFDRIRNTFTEAVANAAPPERRHSIFKELVYKHSKQQYFTREQRDHAATSRKPLPRGFCFGAPGQSASRNVTFVGPTRAPDAGFGWLTTEMVRVSAARKTREPEVPWRRQKLREYREAQEVVDSIVRNAIPLKPPPHTPAAAATANPKGPVKKQILGARRRPRPSPTDQSPNETQAARPFSPWLVGLGAAALASLPPPVPHNVSPAVMDPPRSATPPRTTVLPFLSGGGGVGDTPLGQSTRIQPIAQRRRPRGPYNQAHRQPIHVLPDNVRNIRTTMQAARGSPGERHMLRATAGAATFGHRLAATTSQALAAQVLASLTPSNPGHDRKNGRSLGAGSVVDVSEGSTGPPTPSQQPAQATEATGRIDTGNATDSADTPPMGHTQHVLIALQQQEEPPSGLVRDDMSHTLPVLVGA